MNEIDVHDDIGARVCAAERRYSLVLAMARRLVPDLERPAAERHPERYTWEQKRVLAALEDADEDLRRLHAMAVESSPPLRLVR